jgi:membrane carboxypeptidase/penicillin-binding protein PbpC
MARVVEDAAVTLATGQNASTGIRNAIRAGIAKRENIFIWEGNTDGKKRRDT